MIYPPPSYAASIWLNGDVLMLAVSEAGTVAIPIERLEPQADQQGNVVPGNRGLAVILDILRARMANRAPKIGERAAPVKWDVENALASDNKYKAWLQAMKATKADKAEATKLLEELGL